jgi:ATP-binding protein involved in chromosome partitioning
VVNYYPNIKRIIAVASGKGGVGKSTVAANLALALAKQNARVGILDADIYGPSQPLMLGAKTLPETIDNQRIKPLTLHGLQSMSIGYLVDQNAAMIWRGPMVSAALQQLFNNTEWGNLDYLIIDLPPGTGDIQLTLVQKIPLTGAVIVTTPQELALSDARRAIMMFEKVRVPIFGIIENMGLHRCSKCGHEETIFGEQGGQKLAEEFKVEILGSLPLDQSIREHTDAGRPTVIAEPDGEITQLYLDIAQKLVELIKVKAKKAETEFPKIVIESRQI